MKRVLTILLIVVMVLVLVSCGKARQNAQEQAIENMIENIMEAGNEDVDVDIDSDGESISITSDEGNVTIDSDDDGISWPGDKLPNNVPQPKGVKVISVIDVGEGVYIVFEGVTTKIAEDYEKAMSSNGWEVNFTYDEEGAHTTMATNSSDEMLQFFWDEEDGRGEITYGKQ